MRVFVFQLLFLLYAAASAFPYTNKDPIVPLLVILSNHSENIEYDERIVDIDGNSTFKFRCIGNSPMKMGLLPVSGQTIWKLLVKLIVILFPRVAHQKINHCCIQTQHVKILKVVTA